MSARHLRAIAAVGLAASIAGCATLGGNVKGDFDCRAPEGSCAPTTLIDSAALGEAGIGSAPGVATNQPPLPTGPRLASARSLRIVIAAYRDAAGRDHEARLVHVALPDHPAESWHAPRSTGEVLRALGRAGDSARTPPAPTGQESAPVIDSPPLQLPEVLVIPSQVPEAQAGVSASVTGAPGRPPSPGRVPHPVSPGEPEGESR
jgi:conjugal transfer pilus assembly protein TraV